MFNDRRKKRLPMVGDSLAPLPFSAWFQGKNRRSFHSAHNANWWLNVDYVTLEIRAHPEQIQQLFKNPNEFLGRDTAHG
jgi:hypothetical protein